MQDHFASAPAVYVQIAISILNLLAVVVGLAIAYRQLTKYHDWNRRKASQDLLVQLASGEIRALRGRLEAEFGARIFDPKQTYADAFMAVNSDTTKAEFRFAARTVLNYFESMAIGIKNGVLEDDTCFDYAAETVVAYWRWAQPLVDEVRPVAPLAWIDVEGLTERWTPRQEERLRRHRSSARIPGRKPT